MATIGVPFSDQPSLVGPEFRVNTYTLGNQTSPDVDMDPAGNFVVVWQSTGQDGSGEGIFGQRYAASGEPLGDEFQVNTTSSNNQRAPSVTYKGDGFVVVWSSQGQDGSGYGVFGRRYDSAGVPQGGEFLVNTMTAGDQDFPRVDSDGSSRFVVAWGIGPIRSQVFDNSGTRIGVEFDVSIGCCPDGEPDVAMDATGRFVVAYWDSYDPGPHIEARRYDSTGVPLGARFSVGLSNQYQPEKIAIGTDGPGNFVVAWSSTVLYNNQGSALAQRFGSSGARLGTWFGFDSTLPYNLSRASITRDLSGDFVGAWENLGDDTSGTGVFGKKFNTSGVAQTPEFEINNYMTGEQTKPEISGDGQGRYIVVWESDGQDGSGQGVFAQRLRFCPPLALSPTTPASQSICEGQSASITTPATGDAPLTYQWRRNGQSLVDGGPVSGSTTSTLTIDPVATAHAGSYDCFVTDHCDPAQMHTSTSSSLTVVGKPGSVADLRLEKTGGGASIRLTWTNDPSSQDYVVLQDASPSGSFVTQAGSSSSGATGVTIPMPGGNLYYLVAGRNTTCGLGPSH